MCGWGGGSRGFRVFGFSKGEMDSPGLFKG